ncbi:MAG: FtsQ-type POTRA domain-containing protein [Microbacterium sp.]|uniref:FtsQ-type POTRA domain-containing protein n=1 Tax=Microbacterium sp. TaxID=51671 RepID=UPI001ACAB992|nr:FtsQ-type POTRA domain-containing protein [Microbacterium sp.]MBN9174255.1 FtsQ-type POTRA domain-containing protein [Microbacterium sp.]
MRRPPPLPVPAPRQGGSGQAGSSNDAAEPVETPPPLGRGGAGATSGTGTYRRPAALSTAPADAPPAARADDPVAPSGDVGLRDVWRASRARRRALRAEVRRFTARQRRRRAVWIGAVAALILLVAGTFAAAYSPLFAVERIQVVGTRTLDAAAVAAALHGEIGTPLPLVDDSAVKAALVRFPLVESYTLEGRPPHDLVVRIVERTPVGVVKTAAGYTVVDAAGVALSTTSTAPSGQPVITASGGVHSEAFASIGQVVRSLPASIRAQVTAVAADSPDDVTLTLGGTRTSVVWGSADDSATKALVLEQVMKQRPPASVRQYDVSAPSAVVVR